jgi:hypothetical protein
VPQNIYAGQDLTAALFQSAFPLGAVKLTDESVTSSTTLQNDDTLFSPVAANSTYLVVCVLFYEGGTQGSSDLKFAFTGPAGAGFSQAVARYASNTFGLVYKGGLGTTTACDTAGAGNVNTLLAFAGLTTSATAGTFQLQWAQNTSSTTPAIVHTRSALGLLKMS